MMSVQSTIIENKHPKIIAIITQKTEPKKKKLRK
jgi:hypothetical protein